MALRDEFVYYVEHQEELASKYNGKYIVIKDRKVQGVYDSELDAVNDAANRFELGTFMVKKCEGGEESYTQTFHSRVSFA